MIYKLLLFLVVNSNVTTMSKLTLTTVTGDLRETCSQLQPGSIRHVDELTDERRADPIDADGTDLRHVWLYTADGQLYSLRNGVPTLSMTRGDVNPVLNRIDDAVEQLTTSGNFQPDAEEVDQALNSYSTVHTDLTELRLRGDHLEWQYLPVSTVKRHKLRYEEEKLARRVFGDTTFAENMAMFREAGITESRIYLLAPTYVKEQVSESSLARAQKMRRGSHFCAENLIVVNSLASWSLNFNGNYNFYANVRDFNPHFDRLRGTRMK